MALRTIIILLLCSLLCFSTSAMAAGQQEQVSVLHYFADELGSAGIKAVFDRFSDEHKIAVIENPVGHEEFKTVVLQMAAEGQLPEVTSYWAGARTQFLVDSDALAPLDELWQRGNYDQLIPTALAKTATIYNGQRYLVPFGYHVVGFFYNPKAFRLAGIRQPPKTWSEFIAVCEKLKRAEIAPLALGARNRWPAQFWFDYLLLNTAGPEFRQQLMDGRASYLDPRVQRVMELWAGLLKNAYFADGVSTDDWNDAADRVASGRVGMTLMGTWISGYWGGKGLVAATDYDFFPFPVIDPKQPRIVVGPVDGLVMGAGSANRGPAEQLIDFLLTNLDSQQKWALTQGALSPNLKMSSNTYNRVIKKAVEEVAQADAFVFSYDLATSPPVAEQGLLMFDKFLQHPETYVTILGETDQVAEAILLPQISNGKVSQ